MNPLNNLKNLKEDISLGEVKNAEFLEKRYKEIINLVWENITNEYSANLSDVYKVNSYLIKEVINIHKKEYSKINEGLISEYININEIKSQIEDSKRSRKIYLFNKKNEYYLIGDIHSDSISIHNILNKVEFFNKIVENKDLKLIFMGDYVDRGKEHLKTLQNILMLKYLFPNNIFLLRGNHDGGEYSNNEVKMWVKKSNKTKPRDWFLIYLKDLTEMNISLSKSIIREFLEFFDSLAYIAFVLGENLNYMICHGGIPRYSEGKNNYYDYLSSIKDLTNLEIKDNLNKSIVHNIIWSDPLDGESDDLNKDNGRFKFNESHYEEFKDLIGFDYFIRGHQVKESGYGYNFDNSFITIFSSGKLLKNGININDETAYKKVSPTILKIDESGKNYIIDLNKNINI